MSRLGVSERGTARRSATDSLSPTRLWEAGAVEVVDSPRQFAAPLKLAERHAASRTRLAGSTRPNVESIAERAWAALPWQDALTHVSLESQLPIAK